MTRVFTPRVQAVLVVVLFLGSVGVLLANTVSTLRLPQRQSAARDQLLAAGADTRFPAHQPNVNGMKKRRKTAVPAVRW
jgi:hypothetical protein